MKQPSIYLPHGGGPCFFMAPPPDEPARWVAMEAYLRGLAADLPARPDALLVISAHWEMPVPTVLSAAAPELLFDYANFPPHTYRLTYPAPGAPELAAQVRALLAAAHIASAEDTTRGYDHGIFIPMKVAFPEADIPIVQLSLQQGLDAAAHIAIGQALQGLRDQNVLIIGSGLSFHNLRGLADARLDGPSRDFDDWLTDTLCARPPAERAARLAGWSEAPGARLCHPREEHLLPLMVAAGAGCGEPGRRAFGGTIWNKAVSAYHFG